MEEDKARREGSKKKNVRSISFPAYLKNIKEMKEQAKGELAGMNLAEKSLKYMWEMIFDCIRLENEEGWDSSLKMASVIQKLTNSYVQIKSLSIKNQKIKIESEKWTKIKDESAEMKPANKELTEQTIAKIEQKLKLL